MQANFDDVLVPADHISRSANDTFYVDEQTVLRCHTSAHQVPCRPLLFALKNDSLRFPCYHYIRLAQSKIVAEVVGRVHHNS